MRYKFVIKCNIYRATSTFMESYTQKLVVPGIDLLKLVGTTTYYDVTALSLILNVYSRQVAVHKNA